MAVGATSRGDRSAGDAGGALRSALYLADDGLATAAYLALALGKPLLLEGRAGRRQDGGRQRRSPACSARLIRLQCYEGIDAPRALRVELPRQMLAIRQAGDSLDIYATIF
jgi:hypothetical protein